MVSLQVDRAFDQGEGPQESFRTRDHIGFIIKLSTRNQGMDRQQQCCWSKQLGHNVFAHSLSHSLILSRICSLNKCVDPSAKLWASSLGYKTRSLQNLSSWNIKGLNISECFVAPHGARPAYIIFVCTERKINFLLSSPGTKQYKCSLATQKLTKIESWIGIPKGKLPLLRFCY